MDRYWPNSKELPPGCTFTFHGSPAPVRILIKESQRATLDMIRSTSLIAGFTSYIMDKYATTPGCCCKQLFSMEPLCRDDKLRELLNRGWSMPCTVEIEDAKDVYTKYYNICRPHMEMLVNNLNVLPGDVLKKLDTIEMAVKHLVSVSDKKQILEDMTKLETLVKTEKDELKIVKSLDL